MTRRCSVGPVEFDESYMGGLEKNKHGDKKLNAGTGAVGKAAIAGARDRETGKVMARANQGHQEATHPRVRAQRHGQRRGRNLHGRARRVQGFAAQARDGQSRHRGSTCGITSTPTASSRFWAMFKRGHKGVYHKMSKKHLGRYATEYVGRHNLRPSDTVDQMGAMVRGMDGKRLRYAELIAPNGLESGARGNPPA